MNRHSLYFTEPHTVELRTEPISPLSSNQLLIQTIVSAISPGTEMLLYRGQMPMGMATDDTINALDGTLDYPLKYGYAAVGRVIEIGTSVASHWLDKLVFAFNPHESHFIATPEAAIPLPDGMLPETAVFLPNMETAVSFIMDGQPAIGEQVIVFGQGIVGLLTTALLAQFPLARLVTVEQHPLRQSWSQRLGADQCVDPIQTDAMTHMRQALQADSPYAGADLSFELSGNPQALNMAIQVTGVNGRVVIGSWYGSKQANLNLGGHFHRSQMQLISSQVSRIAPRWNGRWRKPRRFQVAQQMLTKINPAQLITHRLPLTDAQVAYQLIDQSPQQVIQLLFDYPQ
ncbi:MAG: zinc-binding alcohol dehydrogenase [Chloroflexi bacterium]|nr:zinc-binding alcohol dehydrogenase [Chloroflexota bacterium]